MVNELQETADSANTDSISTHTLFRAYQESEEYSLAWDDIYVGENSSWSIIRDRLEEYALLSHLRPGRLEIVYYSIYDQVEALLNSSYRRYVQLYDQLIKREYIEEISAGFSNDFELCFIRLNERDELFPKVNETTLENKEKKVIPLKNQFDFLQIA